MTGFDFSPVLEGAGLRLSPLVEADRAALTAAASDPLIWEGHPAKDRYLPEVFDPYVDFLLSQGGTLTVREAETGRIIGASRFYVPPEAPDDIAIGFTFLTRDHWGGATNRAMKALMLQHAFKVIDTVWFHIDPSNLRSQRATAKLGAAYVDTRTSDLSGKPATWMRFRLDRDVWTAKANGVK